MEQRDKFKALKKKGLIKEKRAREFINELLTDLYSLKLENQSLRWENSELTQNPLVAALNNLERRLGLMEQDIQDVKNKTRDFSRHDEYH